VPEDAHGWMPLAVGAVLIARALRHDVS